jgi:hypothetical protein
MEEKEIPTEASIESFLASLLLNKHVDGGNASVVHAPIEISASPEEGARLVRAFLRIKRPELRVAIINLLTRLADV